MREAVPSTEHLCTPYPIVDTMYSTVTAKNAMFLIMHLIRGKGTKNSYKLKS